MIKRFVLTTLLLFSIVLPIYGFELYNENNEVRVMDIAPGNVSFAWETFDNVSECLRQRNVPTKEWRDNIYRAGDVVMYYHLDLSDDRFRVWMRIWVSSNTVARDFLHNSWKWIDHPHVNFEGNSDIANFHSHPATYYDIISYMSVCGYIPKDLSLVTRNPIVISLDNNLQEMIDNARLAWGLDIFPDSMPPDWTTGVSIRGGDWVKMADDHLDFWIARIDISATNNTIEPEEGAAWRSRIHRRSRWVFDDDDFSETKTVFSSSADGFFQTDSVGISYSENGILLGLATAEKAANVLSMIPHPGRISLEQESGIDKYYVARIISKSISSSSNSVIVLGCDPYEKKGEFAHGEDAIVGISLGPISE